MNTFTTALLALGLGLSAIVATAGDIDAPVAKTVNFAGLDVSTEAGAAQLYRQLKLAARDVCEPANGKSLAQQQHFHACIDTALSNAVAAVNRPLLTNLHESSGKGTAIRVATR